MKETWKWCDGFKGFYKVSSLGRIKSIDRKFIRKNGRPLTIKGKLLKTLPNHRGYPRVSLCKNGKSFWRSVHSLVARAFLTQPNGTIAAGRKNYCVNHKNGDKTNNTVENLEYVTNNQNLEHSRRTGLLDVTGEKNGRSQLIEENIVAIRKEYNQGLTQMQLAKKYGINQTNISRIIRRKTWSHI